MSAQVVYQGLVDGTWSLFLWAELLSKGSSWPWTARVACNPYCREVEDLAVILYHCIQQLMSPIYTPIIQKVVMPDESMAR